MVPGMKKRGGLLLMLKRWLHIKSKDPFALASNVKFGQYSITEQSMSLLMEVYRDKSAMTKRSEDHKRFVVSIGRFPTQINPNSVGYNVSLQIYKNLKHSGKKIENKNSIFRKGNKVL